jgi:hypothetical protein
MHPSKVGRRPRKLEPTRSSSAGEMPKGFPMQVTIACHQCEQPKRPLTPCPACQAAPLAEPELQAWRLSLHARHLARIKQTPSAAPLPQRQPRRLSPLRAVVTLDALELGPAAEPREASIIPLEPALTADQVLSFDWDDEPRKLRKSA